MIVKSLQIHLCQMIWCCFLTDGTKSFHASDKSVAIIEGFSNGSMQLEDFESTRFAIRINGNGLRLYYT